MLQPSSGFYAVGARFVCLSCLRRQLAPHCPRCDSSSDVLDLSQGPVGEVLAPWAGLKAFLKGTGPWDPRSVFRVRSLRRFWWLGVILIGLGSLGGVLIGEGLLEKMIAGSFGPEVWGTLLGVTIAAVFMAPVMWWAAVWFYAQLARAVARIRYRIAAAIPGLRSAVEGAAGLVFARGKIRLVNGMFRWIEHKLAPELRVEPVAAYRAEKAFSGEAFLAQPLSLSLLWDGAGWLELRDSGPCQVSIESMDKDRVTVHLDCGIMIFDPGRGELCGTGQDLPDWLVGLHTRRTRVAGVCFPVGTLVRLEGGLWAEGEQDQILRSSQDQPILLEILED